MAVASLPMAMGMAGCWRSDISAPDATATEDISYADGTDLGFTNNKILLKGKSGADPAEVKLALAKYGEVDDSNAGAGMYAVTIEGHLDSASLADLIDEIVATEPLIEEGSINWVLPDQQVAPSATPSKTE